jgi:hypothetical protein
MEVNRTEYGRHAMFTFQKPNLAPLQLKYTFPLRNNLPIHLDDTVQFMKRVLMFLEILNKGEPTLVLERFISDLRVMTILIESREIRRFDLVDGGRRHFRIFRRRNNFG